jgi:hypothetical protein
LNWLFKSDLEMKSSNNSCSVVESLGDWKLKSINLFRFVFNEPLRLCYFEIWNVIQTFFGFDWFDDFSQTVIILYSNNSIRAIKSGWIMLDTTTFRPYLRIWKTYISNVQPANQCIFISSKLVVTYHNGTSKLSVLYDNYLLKAI